MEIICKPLGPVQANSYLIIQKSEALLVDPGAEYPNLQAILDEKQASLKAILLTHAHFDHIGGVDSIVEKFHVPVYLNPKEFSFLTDSKLNSSFYFGCHTLCKTKPEALKEGKMQIGNFEIFVHYCPGHSCGSSIFQIEDALFTGDTLFASSVGRMDLPTGSVQDMDASVAYLKTLPGFLHVYPGHGPETLLNYEKQTNPYF